MYVIKQFVQETHKCKKYVIASINCHYDDVEMTYRV